jgi:16S rRNA A1518/A1519 N6-dimethyltransferase RsmA/KsgA/DIM1 with predicted DNA glycosylase/AP lyase activity
MFQPENQFYPTPKAIAEKMIAPYIKTYERHYSGYKAFEVKSLKIDYPVLEPSAGKGDLLDALCEIRDDNRRDKRDLYAIELDPELRMILNEKGYTVLSADFLAFAEPLEFGFIIMNPPFNEADKHITHAWKFLKAGGELVALCNSETVRNPCDKNRQLLANLIDAHGTVEHLGACFADSDRPTNVEISLIRLTKPEKEHEEIEFDASSFKRDYITDEEFSANPLAHADYLTSLVAQYKSAERLIIERQKLNKQLEFYIVKEKYGSDDLDKIANIALSDQIEALKTRFWNMVFSKAKIASKLTGSFKSNFESFRRQQQNMAFSSENIQEMLLMFFTNYEDIMLNCLVEIFDKLTAFCEENKVHTEGWVTNKGYRLNHKVIYPYGVRFDYGSFRCYGTSEILTDIDKTLCWLEGRKYEEMHSGECIYSVLDNHCHLANHGERSYTDKFYSRYFEMRMYKKGTLHLVFRDKKLLNEFNMKAAKGKNWIGGKGF